MAKIPRCVDKRILKGIVNYFDYLKGICGIDAEFPDICLSVNKKVVSFLNYNRKLNEIWVTPAEWGKLSNQEQKLNLAAELGHAIRAFAMGYAKNEEKEAKNKDRYYLTYQNFPIKLSEFHELASEIIYTRLKIKNKNVFEKVVNRSKDYLNKERWNTLVDNLLQNKKIGCITKENGEQISINVAGEPFERALKTHTLACLSYKNNMEKLLKNKNFELLENDLLHIMTIPAIEYLEKKGFLNYNSKISEKKIKEMFFISEKSLEEMFITAIPCMKKFVIRE